MRKIYQALAQFVEARLRCIETKNDEWQSRHEERIQALATEHLPSGSGFDNGTTFNLNESTADKLVFDTSFHHMNEGMYDGWTDHTVTVTPSLAHEFKLKVSGKDKNDIKEYIADAFHAALDADEPVEVKL